MGLLKTENNQIIREYKTKPIDGVKTGEIDEMFINEAGKQDGGAIQFITPFSIFALKKAGLISSEPILSGLVIAE